MHFLELIQAQLASVLHGSLHELIHHKWSDVLALHTLFCRAQTVRRVRVQGDRVVKVRELGISLETLTRLSCGIVETLAHDLEFDVQNVGEVGFSGVSSIADRLGAKR
jgi:hypothetical protein